MKRHLQCAEQQVSPSNLTKYCACHEKWHLNFTKYCAYHEKWHLNFTKYCACHAERLTYLVLIAYETSFTMRGATGVTIQPHQILRLPRKMTRQLYRPHIWNVISNARSNRCHYPTSPNTAPATKNDTARFQRKSPKTGETSFPMRGRSDHDPRMIREWKRKPQPASQVRLLFEVPRSIFYCKIQRFAPNLTFKPSPSAAPATKKWHLNFTKYCAYHEKWHLNFTKYCACHEKWHLNFTKDCAYHEKWHLNFTKYCACHAERLTYLVLIAYETSFTVRGATGVTIQPHQIMRLPRKMTRQLYRPHIWNVISNARSNRCHYPTSPNTAPATKNDSTAFSSSHMKRHFQCAEQQVSLSNLTKYCACHEKWHCKISKKISNNRWNVISNAGTIRPWSDHDPRMIREWKRKPQPASQPRLLFELTTSIFYWKIQRFAPNLTFKPSPNTAPATKSATWTSPDSAPTTKNKTGTSPSTVPATKSDTWTSPNTAPTTKSDTWNFTKYCACHAEKLTYLVLIAYETSFTVRGATGVTIQPHQILRLPRKMTRLLFRPHIWNVISNARSNRCHYPTSPNTAPATKNDTARFQRKSPITGETSFPMRGRSDHDPTMIREWSENENANRNPPRNRGYFSSSPRAFSIEKYNVSRPILHSNLHPILRLPRKVPLELHQILRLPRKVTLELHQVLRLPRKVTLELHQVLRLPRKVTLDSTWHYSTWLYSTWLYFTWLYSTWLYSTWHYSTWLYSTWHYSTWHYSTWLYSTWLDSTWLDSTLLDSTLLDFTLLDSTLLDTILLDSTLLDSTLLDSTLLDSTLLDTILLDSTLLDSTLLDSTLLDSTLLDLTLLGCRSYIGSFWAKLPLMT